MTKQEKIERYVKVGGKWLKVDRVPDMVEVVHGEWLAVHDWLQIPQEERGTYRCSACGQVMKYPLNYCPNCGAVMKGAER